MGVLPVNPQPRGRRETFEFVSSFAFNDYCSTGMVPVSLSKSCKINKKNHVTAGAGVAALCMCGVFDTRRVNPLYMFKRDAPASDGST